MEEDDEYLLDPSSYEEEKAPPKKSNTGMIVGIVVAIVVVIIVIAVILLILYFTVWSKPEESPGNQGNQGSQGNQGNQGSQGNGNQGNQGSQGNGNQGNQGFSGNQGQPNAIAVVLPNSSEGMKLPQLLVNYNDPSGKTPLGYYKHEAVNGVTTYTCMLSDPAKAIGWRITNSTKYSIKFILSDVVSHQTCLSSPNTNKGTNYGVTEISPGNQAAWNTVTYNGLYPAAYQYQYIAMTVSVPGSSNPPYFYTAPLSSTTLAYRDFTVTETTSENGKPCFKISYYEYSVNGTKTGPNTGYNGGNPICIAV